MRTAIHAFVIFLWLEMDSGSRGEQVEQHPSSLSVQEGDNAVINCTYTDSGSAYFPWYKQEPGKGPQFIVDIRSNMERKEHQRLTLLLNKKEKHLSLHITATQPGDSAIYFCAADRDTGGGDRLTFGQGTQLTIQPHIEDPKPAVYQMRDTQSKDSICLFTDFDSQISVSSSTSPDVFISNKTVLNMKSMDSKSNGAIAWSNQADLNCRDAFKENTSYPSEDVPCDAKLIEKSFETDMNLNFQNLSVMGLRILLLKVAGFNLLMTLRLWSS